MHKVDSHTASSEDRVQTTHRASLGQITGLSFDEFMLQYYGYQIIDEVVAYLNDIRERPVWQEMPADIHKTIRQQQLPVRGLPFEETLAFIREKILPYPQGNGHP